MATTTGKLDVQVKVKSNADKFWNSIMDFVNISPKVSPDFFDSIQVLEGDGKSVGSVRLVNFGQGHTMKSAKEKIEELDEVNRKVAYSVIGGDMTQYYKSWKASLEVIPEGEGSLVKWACEFEKASDEVPNPDGLKDLLPKHFKDIDDYLLKA